MLDLERFRHGLVHGSGPRSAQKSDEMEKKEWPVDWCSPC
eukprot:SAG31_NODE_34141_length_336_cov_0.654008_2_plen_39_part_01